MNVVFARVVDNKTRERGSVDAVISAAGGTRFDLVARQGGQR